MLQEAIAHFEMGSTGVAFSACCALLALTSALGALPDGWNACKQSSPDYENCLLKEITNAVHSLKEDNRKLGVLSLDPLKFDELIITQGSGPVSLKLSLKKADFRGFATSNFTRVKNDWKTFEIEFFCPLFVVEGEYKANGKILTIHINGEGWCHLDFHNLKVKGTVNLKEVEKGGQKYFMATKIVFDFIPEHVEFDFQRLHGDATSAGFMITKFVNDNWRIIVDEMKPAIIKAMEIGLKEYMNRILSKIPANEINLK